jgi:hypothetical protein
MKSNNTPRIFGSVAKFAAGDTSREAVVADRYLVVDDTIGESIGTFRHRTNKDTYTFIVSYSIHIISNRYDFSVET